MPDPTDSSQTPPPPPSPEPEPSATSASTGLPSNVAAAIACIALIVCIIFYILEQRDCFLSLYAMQCIIMVCLSAARHAAHSATVTEIIFLRATSRRPPLKSAHDRVAWSRVEDLPRDTPAWLQSAVWFRTGAHAVLRFPAHKR